MDETLRSTIEKCVEDGLLQGIVSNPRRKEGTTKIRIRPVLIRGELLYQEETFRNNQVFHENLTAERLVERFETWSEEFRQIELKGKRESHVCLIGKKGNVNVKTRRNPKETAPASPESFAHNRTKQYLLPQDSPVDFLIELGIMTKEGKVRDKKQDKFRQINRFLEFIEDVAGKLPKDREINVLDFGCGKSYLTFAMYYYLHQKKGMDVRITGLDLKEDVIRNCNALKEKLGYEKLRFLTGDIAEYDGQEQVDMVVTLHACDVATDYALAKAIGWNASVILSVPCCQHELNRVMDCDVLSPIFQHGLLKERVAALFTDGLRACLLEEMGYHVNVLEFIDMSHTPKNVLIRAVKGAGTPDPRRTEAYEKCRDFLNGSLTLERLLVELREAGNDKEGNN